MNIVYMPAGRMVWQDVSKKFYEKHKNLEVKLFIKADAGTLYSEYEVKSWRLNDKGIEVILTK